MGLDHKMENTEKAVSVCVCETSEAMTRSVDLFNMQKEINERKNIRQENNIVLFICDKECTK